MTAFPRAPNRHGECGSPSLPLYWWGTPVIGHPHRHLAFDGEAVGDAHAIRSSEPWERPPDCLGAGPQAHAEATAILAAIRRVTGTGRPPPPSSACFVVIVVDGILLDALAARLGVRRFGNRS
jgi:hypothetical protein